MVADLNMDGFAHLCDDSTLPSIPAVQQRSRLLRNQWVTTEAEGQHTECMRLAAGQCPTHHIGREPGPLSRGALCAV
jgi:hypothetical protein